MEAVPRLPMLSFEMKISPVCPDFATPFKRFISKYYGEDGDMYDREILELETLRNNACRAPRDETGCSILKRYYCQLSSIYNRFNSLDDDNDQNSKQSSTKNHQLGIQCVWADIYSGQTTIGDIDFELSCILYNIGALHGDLGAMIEQRQTQEEMRMACTHFQCATWAFQQLISKEREKYYRTSDICNDIIQFFIQIMLAQAQECILEKSMLDNRKSSIIAKITKQIVDYYQQSIQMLQQNTMMTTPSTTIIEIIGSKLFKQWKSFIEFKLSYYNSICSLYMGNSYDDQSIQQQQQQQSSSTQTPEYGERIAWYESALEKIQHSTLLAKQFDSNMQGLTQIMDALSFVTDVITIKLQNAKKENDFIYHSKVPSIHSLPEIKGVSLVKGIPFNICDPEVSGPDIFKRLVPIKAHELLSIYSMKKDEILRNIREKIDEKNQELISYMSSLMLDKEQLRSPKEESIPDELINICAELSLQPESLDEVAQTLTKLDQISNETGKIIQESRELLDNENEKEQKHQEIYGKRPSSMIIMELSKELDKHNETHRKAIESNKSLWDNYDQHKDDIRIMMSSSASRIASILPSNKSIKFDEKIIVEMEKLFDKIDEMKTQREQFENDLKKQLDSDNNNIMKKILSYPKNEIESIFDEEIKKYDKIIKLIEQNLSAQKNILNAMTNLNANYADTRKQLMEVQCNRKTRIASLLYTYQIFKELQSNSQKGLEFYKKFQTIVVRLNARIRGVSKVQDEERQQFIQAQKPPQPMMSALPPTPPQVPSIQSVINSDNNLPGMPSGPLPPSIPATGAKLKDYLPFMKGGGGGAGRLNFLPPAPTMIPPSNPSTSMVLPPGPTQRPPSSSPSTYIPSAPSPSLTPPSSAAMMMNNRLPPQSIPGHINTSASLPATAVQSIAAYGSNTSTTAMIPSQHSQTIPQPYGSTSNGMMMTTTTMMNTSLNNHQPIQHQPITPSSMNMLNTSLNNTNSISSPQPSATPAPNPYNQQYPVTSTNMNNYGNNNVSTGYPLTQLPPSSSLPSHSMPQPSQPMPQPSPIANYQQPSQQPYPLPQSHLQQQISQPMMPPFSSTATIPQNLPYPITQSSLMPSYPGANATTMTTPASAAANVASATNNLQYNYPRYPISDYHGMPQPTINGASTGVGGAAGMNPATSGYQVPQPQPVVQNVQNITEILEQESKRGWQVLTPTPVSTLQPSSSSSSSSTTTTTTVTTTTTTTNVIKDSSDKNNNNNDNSKSSSSNASDCLPDILSTMSLNGNNGCTVSQTIKPENMIVTSNGGCSQPSSIVTTTNNSSSNANNTNTVNAPKDLLSQFDPLFT